MNAQSTLEKTFYAVKFIDAYEMDLQQTREMSVLARSVNASDETVQAFYIIEREIEQKRQDNIDLLHQIIELIKSVQDERFRFILTRRYLDFNKWHYIAEEMNVGLDYVQKLNKKALESLEISGLVTRKEQNMVKRLEFQG